jgi:RNA polymerase sigma-70 factor, ECF subfamily
LLARLEVRRRLQAKLDAEDLVQDTFLKAHRHFDQFRGTTESEFVGWLRQILGSTLANLMRHHLGTKRRAVDLERELVVALDESSEALEQGLASKQSSPSQRASRREEAVLLADALDRLPEDYREIMVLRHLEGLTFPDVARRMGRSLESVKKLWARALGRLRDELI